MEHEYLSKSPHLAVQYKLFSLFHCICNTFDQLVVLNNRSVRQQRHGTLLRTMDVVMMD